MFKMNLLSVLVLLIVPLCSIALTVRARSDVDLRQVCSSDSADSAITRIEDAKSLLDQYYVHGGQECPAEYDEAFRALKVLLSDSLLDNVCSPASIDAIHDFHTKFIYDISPEMNNDAIKARKKLPKAERTNPLPPALKVFFILFAKQINAQCTEEFINKIAEHSQDSDLDFMASITNAGSDRKFKKLRQSVRKWIVARKFGDLEYVKLTKPAPVAVPYKPNVARLYNLCKKRFQPILDTLLEPVVRLNNLGYQDHYILSDELKQRLKNDEQLKRWYGTFQFCEIMKNVDMIAIPEPVKNKSKGYAAKLGFLTEQLAAEARKIAVQIDDTDVEPILVEAQPVKLRPSSRSLTDSEVRTEVRKHKQIMKSVLKDRVNPMIVMEKHVLMSMLRSMGIQPLPHRLQLSQGALLLFALFVFVLGVGLVVAVIFLG